MDEKEVIKRYEKGDLTVIWKPKMCIHSAICANGLGDVFDPKARPWIQVDGASSEAIRAQIDKCPSGALSYEVRGSAAGDQSTLERTTVTVIPCGPILVDGVMEITHADGTTEVRERRTSFCRCGASHNKPFCDGSHKEQDFDS